MEQLASSIRAANVWGGGQNQPHSWSFSSDGSRVYFLLNGGLLVSNTGNGLQEAKSALDKDAVRRSAPMSKEEELLRERMRSSATGVTKFDHHAATQQLVVEAEGTLFTLNEHDGLCSEIPASRAGARLHTSLSFDGKLLGFVRERNLWLVETSTGREIRVSDASGTWLAGAGDFIHQEEFTTYRTYWIAPCAPLKDEYKVLYLEMDESPIHVYNLPLPGINGEVDPTRYALTGTSNSKVRAVLATVHLASGRVTRRILHKALLPWTEYVPRGGWFPDGNACWFVVQDRSQTRGALLRVDLSDQGFPVVLHETKSTYWVNASLDMLMPLHFFPDGSLLIASEEVGGFAHLYRLGGAGGGKLVPITAGSDWQVNVKVKWTEGVNNVWVDDAHQVVYFSGRKDGPLESHLYCVSFRNGADPSNAVRLTLLGFDHYNLHVCTTHFVDSYSNLNTPPTTALHALVWESDGQVLPLVRHMSERPAYAPSVPICPFGKADPPKPFVIESHGHKLHGVTYLPPNFDASHSYPTIIYTYGGPHVQLVENNWALTRGPRSSRWQLLASMGYVVSVMDGRGSINRGLDFEGEIRWKMGTIELDDQVAHVQHLIAQGITDARRVAVYGSSYGGYMALLAMCKRHDVFKIGYSFSPVTDWLAYDTGYTERYMGLPSENPEGYKTGSIVAHAPGFPSEPNRLVIFHGASDENVHFAHTSILVSRMADLLKPYDLQVYPEDRHGISRGALHSAMKMISHIKQHL